MKYHNLLKAHTHTAHSDKSPCVTLADIDLNVIAIPVRALHFCRFNDMDVGWIPARENDFFLRSPVSALRRKTEMQRKNNSAIQASV